MYSTLYQKADLQLPYCIDTRYFKWIEEGKQKEKFEQRWVVYTEEVNTFIEGLAVNHEELALANVSREDRGPLTIVTATYGDNGLTNEEALELDGEIDWWTVSGGVKTFHIRRWVTNTPEEIKAFCEHCMSDYGYEPEQVSVSCNPQAGEPEVMCEATFTEDVEEDPEFDPTTSDDDEDKKETEGINCSSTIDTLTPSAALYLERKMNLATGDGATILKIINGVEAGELVYRKAGSLGGRVIDSGWYSTDDTNPNALNEPVYREGGGSNNESSDGTTGDGNDGTTGGGNESSNGTTTTANVNKANVDKARVLIKNIPDVMVPSIRITVTETITTKKKLTAVAMVNSFTSAGQKGNTISITNGVQIPAPAITEGWDAEGITYPLKSVEWMDEGTSFDGSTVKKRSSLTTGRSFYQGTMSKSFRSIATLMPACAEGTVSQTI